LREQSVIGSISNHDGGAEQKHGLKDRSAVCTYGLTIRIKLNYLKEMKDTKFVKLISTSYKWLVIEFESNSNFLPPKLT